jgi:hypothetical protein
MTSRTAASSCRFTKCSFGLASATLPRSAAAATSRPSSWRRSRSRGDRESDEAGQSKAEAAPRSPRRKLIKYLRLAGLRLATPRPTPPGRAEPCPDGDPLCSSPLPLVKAHICPLAACKAVYGRDSRWRPQTASSPRERRSSRLPPTDGVARLAHRQQIRRRVKRTPNRILDPQHFRHRRFAAALANVTAPECDIIGDPKHRRHVGWISTLVATHRSPPAARPELRVHPA